MNKIDFKKYKRLFAFGCSFTDYHWPTWANILSQEIPDTKIFGKSGAGNFFIYQSLIEANIRYNITKDDLVMIMFSNVTREDRFIYDRGGWITPGNLFHQSEYDEHFMKTSFCHHGYLMRDLNLIYGCKTLLDSIGCDHELMSIVPFESLKSDGLMMQGVDYLLDFHKDTLSQIKPSVFETVFKNDWNTRLPRPKYKVCWTTEKYVDNHPTPLEHFEYLKLTFPDTTFAQSTIDYVNNHDQTVFSENFSDDSLVYDKKLSSRLGVTYGI